MNVSVFGLGKVGTTLSACLAKAGHRVIGVDVNETIVAAINDGSFTTSEPGVMERIAGAPRAAFTATLDPTAAVRDTDFSFVIVPTNSNTLGGFSNRYVIASCEAIGRGLRAKTGAHTVSIVSTMMPGSSELQVIPALEQAAARKIGDGLGYCYNPSFIAQGDVVKGFEHPDFLLIGEADAASGENVLEVHTSMVQNDAPRARMSPIEAEVAKLASNTHETMRVSFANMLLSICNEIPHADVDRITGALSHRMGRRFFKGAVPYGGPCWPRDNVALSSFMETIGIPSLLPRTVDLFNAEHGRYVLRKVLEATALDSRVGVIGLSYKPGTWLIDRSFSIDLVGWLLDEGRKVAAWDPLALDEARKVFDDRLTYCATHDELLDGCDVVVVTLPLPELQQINWSAAANATVIDCWRAIGTEGRQAIGRYVPLGIGAPGRLDERFAQGGRKFSLLTS